MQKLHVEGSSYFGSDMFTNTEGGIFFSGNVNYSSGIYSRNAGNDLVLQAGNFERMRITSSGNVGIGTTSATEKLDVNGNVLVQGLLKLKPQTSEPTGVEGAIYYNSTTKKHYGFDGTTWNALY